MKWNAVKTAVYLSQTIDNYSMIILWLLLIEYASEVKTRKCFKTNLTEMFICPNENGVSALQMGYNAWDAHEILCLSWIPMCHFLHILKTVTAWNVVSYFVYQTES